MPVKILVVEWRRRQGELAALKTPAGRASPGWGDFPRLALRGNGCISYT